MKDDRSIMQALYAEHGIVVENLARKGLVEITGYTSDGGINFCLPKEKHCGCIAVLSPAGGRPAWGGPAQRDRHRRYMGQLRSGTARNAHQLRSYKLMT